MKQTIILILKNEYESSFSQHKNEIQKDRNNFNKILESLLDEKYYLKLSILIIY